MLSNNISYYPYLHIYVSTYIYIWTEDMGMSGNATIFTALYSDTVPFHKPGILDCFG